MVIGMIGAYDYPGGSRNNYPVGSRNDCPDDNRVPLPAEQYSNACSRYHILMVVGMIGAATTNAVLMRYYECRGLRLQ